MDPTQNDEALSITVADGGPLDADTDAGQILLAGACFGTYTITETGAPSGYALDDDPTRVVTVNDASKDVTVGSALGDPPATSVDDDPRTTHGAGDCAAEDCDFHNRLGTIEWEKRDESLLDGDVHPLQKGATFEISPNPHPGTGGDLTGITDCVVPDVANCDALEDKDPDAGQFLIERVGVLTVLPCYTVTETAAPTGFAKDDDDEREDVCVSEGALAAVIGSALATPPADSIDDHEGTGDGVANCTGDLEECDFHNRRGSLIWEKRAKDASVEGDPLLGGATFSIDKNPHTGAAGAFPVTDCIVPDVANCDALEDKDEDAGQICIDQVKLNEPFQITETDSPDSTKYKKSDATLNATVTLSSVCPAGTDAGDFINTPLSEIEVIFRSLAGPGVTIASIVCKDPSGTVIDAVAENGSDDPALDDTDEVFTALVPVANIATDKYTCEVVIDP